jgi:hypothetical protein
MSFRIVNPVSVEINTIDGNQTKLIQGVLSQTISVGETTPSNPIDDNLWIDTNPLPTNIKSVIAVDSTPPNSPDINDLWLDTT